MLSSGVIIIRAYLHKLEDTALVLLAFVLLAISLLQIVLRNADIGMALWTDSALRNLVLWLSLLGAMRASRLQEHITIDLITPLVSNLRLRRMLHSMIAVVCCAVCLVAAYYSASFIALEYQDNTPSAIPLMPSWSLQAIIPLAFMVMGVRFAFQAVGLSFYHSNTRR